MASEWRWTTLGGIAADNGRGIVDGPFGSNLPASLYATSGIPVIRGSNLTLGVSRFVPDEFVFVSEAAAMALARSLCRPLDILFTKKGTIGQTGLVPHDGPYDLYLLSSNQMRLTVDATVADPMFVYYYVSNASSVQKIIRDSEATGVPKINLSYLREFPILLPPLSQQQAIARTLGALDDKIELSRRMSQTLESMARALFRSWFVDFDPVRAIAEGRDTGLGSAVAELFPAGVEDSDVGEIPAGWRVADVGDLIELAYGKAMKAEDRKPGPVAVYGSNGQVGWHNDALTRGPGIVVGRKGNPGTVTWVTSDFFPIDTTFYVVPKSPQLGLAFLYHALRNHDLASLGADSAVPGLNRNLAYMSRQLVPPMPIVDKFDLLVEGLSQRGHACVLEASSLSALRDSLLSQFLSGLASLPGDATTVGAS